jgi:SpoVK/Ycf46/Vps4 family AAA+-type ATPase
MDAKRITFIAKELLGMVVLAVGGYVLYCSYDQLLIEPRRNEKKKLAELAGKLGKSATEIGDLTEHELTLSGDVIRNADIDVSFADIGGMGTELQEVRDNVILPMRHWKEMQDITQVSTCPPGVLLYGKPGTGKTMTAKAIAKESGATFLSIKASSIMCKWVGESEKLVAAMFSLARKLAPTVIFIDEIDTILKKRDNSSTSNSHMSAALGLLMQEWDGLLTSSGQGDRQPPVVVLGATNRPGDIDAAFQRRMPFRLMTKAPDVTGRHDILKLQLKSMALPALLDLQLVASQTEGFTGAELKELCRLVSLVRLKAALVKKGLAEGVPASVVSTTEGAYELTNEDFSAAIFRMKPSATINRQI